MRNIFYRFLLFFCIVCLIITPDLSAQVNQWKDQLEKSPNDMVLILKIGRHYYELASISREKKDIKETEKYFKNLLEISPENSIGRVYSGSINIMKADNTILPWKIFNYLKKGFSLMDEAVELNPDEPEVRLIRASTCTMIPKFLGKRKIALEDFKHIQNLDNSLKQKLTKRFWLPFYYYYGLVLAAEEELVAAEEKFLKVLDIDPQSSYARRSEKELEKIYFSAK